MVMLDVVSLIMNEAVLRADKGGSLCDFFAVLFHIHIGGQAKRTV
jgi:hypothetical protein